MESPVYLSVVLPAYNEAGAIRRTLVAMRTFLDDQGFNYEVIVAADGDDDTPRLVEEFAREWPSLKLTARRGRHGKGSGIKRGLALASGQVVGFLDADYKTPVDEVTKLLPWLHDGYDLVCGSRALDESRVEIKQPLYRQLGSRVFGFVMRWLTGLHHITDSQCGFKFFRRDVAEAIFSRTRIDGYMIDVEILVLAKRLGYQVKEVGIRWRDDGDTRFHPVSGALADMAELLRIRLRHL